MVGKNDPVGVLPLDYCEVGGCVWVSIVDGKGGAGGEQGGEGGELGEGGDDCGLVAFVWLWGCEGVEGCAEGVYVVAQGFPMGVGVGGEVEGGCALAGDVEESGGAGVGGFADAVVSALCVGGGVGGEVA